MSRRKLKARDKIIQRMSRDGLIERNNATGADIRVSRREADFDIGGGEAPVREPLSQAGTRANDNKNRNKQAVYRRGGYSFETEPSAQYPQPEADSSLSYVKGQSKAEADSREAWHQAAPQEKSHKRKKRAINKKRSGGNARGALNTPVRGTERVSPLNLKPDVPQTDKQLNAPDTHVIPPPQAAAYYDKSSEPPEQTGKKSKYKKRNHTVLRHEKPVTVLDEPQKPDSPLNFSHDGLNGGERNETPGLPQADDTGSNLSERPALSQSGTRSKRKDRQTKKAAYRHNKTASLQDAPQVTASVHGAADTAIEPRKPELTHLASTEKNLSSINSKAENAVPRERRLYFHGDRNGKDTVSNDGNKPVQIIKRRGTGTFRYKKPSALQHRPQKADSQLTFGNETASALENAQVITPTDMPAPKRSGSPIVQPGNDSNYKISLYNELNNKTERNPQITAAEQTDILPLIKYGDGQAEQPGEPEAAPQVENPPAYQPPSRPDSDDNESTEVQPNDDWRDSAEPAAAETKTSELKDTPNTPLNQNSGSKLKFADNDTAEGAPGSHATTNGKLNRKLVKAERQAERAGTELEKARDKLPAKKKLRSERVFDEQSGKAKQRLFFEKEIKTEGQHMKGALPLRPVKAVSNAAILNAHRKIYQVEHENVGVKAAHRAESAAEGVVRSALRQHRSAPYRRVRKLEKQAAKKTVKLNYQKALAENPNLSSNMLSRMIQKRKIKKNYANAAREARRTAQAAKNTGTAAARAFKVLAGAIRNHPIAAGTVILLALLLFVFMSLFGLGSGIGGGSITTVISSSYLAGDADIEKAEIDYSEWETDLQLQIANVQSGHPGFDEYRYDTGEISHNPYELAAYLTAVYYDYSYGDISADLQALFNGQYSLTFTETAETRYADPEDADGDGDYEPYDWKVLTVSLDTRSFSDVISSRMNAEQRQHYDILMQTKGNRQYAGNPFSAGWLPYISSYYGWRVHPITGEKDLHRGIDIAFPSGTEIRSAQDGTVTFAGNSGSYGNLVIIEDENGLVTKYAHCESLFASAGQTVSKGDVIATVGSTGDSTGAHLHYELMKDGEYLNPAIFTDTGSFSVTPEYGAPGAPLGGGSYSALIEEAESHIGKPYRFGANGSDSFDCSSFISYILTQSGIKNLPRTTAQGIFNQSTPISESEARPGDLITFQGTYSTTNTVTHIGLYVGTVDGHPTMLHAGSPVQYTRIDTNYWQNHFYSYARLN